jgi:predicted heme/steroid binding protein
MTCRKEFTFSGPAGWYRNLLSDNLEEKLISLSQLALRNGQDKPEIWIAFKGKIYDVTNSRLWRTGMHYEHWAGQDLTNELKDAPHTDQVFDELPVIGKLITATG